MDLLGVDVGFSKVQKSTGIACFCGGTLVAYRADSSWEDRKQGLPESFAPEIIAIDGPLLPLTAEPLLVRKCEQFFSRGLFCRRCKPGLSHFGTGLQLREAAHETSHQFCQHFYQEERPLGTRLVEAFPNLFLGVMVKEEDYAAIPKLRRGQKFDWLYERATLKLNLLREFTELPCLVHDRVIVEKDHELRAALICLLTAALAAKNKAVKAGSEADGWFWLPPTALWEPWALAAATTNLDEF